MQIDQCVNRFYAYLLTEKRVSQNTFCAYRSDVEQFLAFLEQQSVKQMDVITYDHLHQFLTLLYEKKVSARSIVRKISAIKLFFRYMHERFHCTDPSAGLPFPKVEKKLPQFLTENEVGQLLQAATAINGNNALLIKVIVYTLYITGMRVSELINLTVADIFFDRSYIMVKGKGGKQRTLPIAPILHTLLEQWLSQATVVKIGPKTAVQKQAVLYLFYMIDKQGVCKQLSRQYVWVVLKKLWSSTGNNKRISPHMLRHSFATHFLKNGVDLRSLQMLLGHENIATVAIYTHVETSHLATLYHKKHPRS